MTQGRVTVRPATQEDAPALAQLRWDARAEDGSEVPAVDRVSFLAECSEFFRRGMAGGSQAYWIAELQGSIVAHVAVHRIDLIPRPVKIVDQFGVITENYTQPALRNQGIGSLLLKHVIDWAANQDYELLIVYPSERAVPFYERHGFQHSGEVMELRLRPYA
jgi:GNAT superfamily N-acetyltransferase